ncbi:RNA polymerase sigma factor [Nocardia sp. NPDC101769]|uniref:RNA polymerase sigma factor n=1 Tax=Nocardia sp. NPDC101769 TaxID=3364333 RepID=UPI00380D338C
MSRSEENAAFVQENLSRIARRALYLCGDFHVAEDLAQEAFERVLKSQVKSQSALSVPLLYTALEWSWKDHLRRKYRRKENIVSQIDDAPDPEVASIDVPLHEAIDELPETMRSIVLMHYYDDMKPAEIAQEMGIRADQVSRHLNRARKKLEKRLS